MIIDHQPLRPGNRPSLLQARAGELQLVVARGRSISASVRAEHSICIPLRGGVHVETSEGALHLQPRQALIWNHDEIRIIASAHSLWLCLHGTASSWKRAMIGLAPASELRDPFLYPHLEKRPTALIRGMVRLAMRLRDCAPSDDQPRDALRNTLAALLDTQREIDRLSMRCAGHSQSRRRHNLMRLIRVRSRIMMNPGGRLELSAMAAAANYSSWHFIRAFKQAFDETPCEYAGRVRMEHARYLIAKTPMSITEVAESIGYDSRSAFCRSFRTAFGINPSRARNRSIAMENPGSRSERSIA